MTTDVLFMKSLHFGFSSHQLSNQCIGFRLSATGDAENGKSGSFIAMTTNLLLKLCVWTWQTRKMRRQHPHRR